MKKIVKLIIIFIEAIVAIPISLIFVLLGILADYIDRYSSISMIVSKIPLYVGEIIRIIYYKLTLKKAGIKVIYQQGSCILYRDTEIGENIRIGYNTIIGLCKIGNDVLLGSNINILSGKNQHCFQDKCKLIREQKGVKKKINIGNNLWIGSNTTIASNICDNVIIGLNSNVICDIDKEGIYAGNPAKFIKEI